MKCHSKGRYHVLGLSIPRLAKRKRESRKSTLPKPVRQRLATEFKFAATKIAETGDINTKVYYFSVFFGETGRQLNMHWDADLALLWSVTQNLCNAVGSRSAQAAGAFPVGGFPDEFLQAIDAVSIELDGAFDGVELDLPRLHAAMERTAELTFATTGNGAYLVQKGTIKL